ncbi:MAG: hypothetical protein DRP02_04015 [Candidatus Gerdarchaeota archaeon]|nr:MAG: hypothetical protein DRP02_04015 [Candidatus Gerdarchaeota archaeon]
MSVERKFEKITLSASILAMIGTVLIIIGIGIGSAFLTDVRLLALIVLILGIFVISVITFIGSLPANRFQFTDERPALLAFLALFFAPFTLISNYTTPLYLLIKLVIGESSISLLHYFTLGGIFLMTISFLLFVWVFFWKLPERRPTLEENSELPIAKALAQITGFLTMVAIIGVIIGLLFPVSDSRNSLLQTSLGAVVSPSALAFLFYLLMIFTTALFVFISPFEKVAIPRTDLALLFLLFTFLALPGYEPLTASTSIWSSPVYKLLEYGLLVFSDMNIFGWILLTSVLLNVFALLLGVLTFFLKISAFVSEEVVRTPRRRQKPLVQSESTQGSETLGTLAQTLASSTTTQTPPTTVPTSQSVPTSSGPPSATVKPLSGAPPSASPPAFGISTQPATKQTTPTKTLERQKPTCPFCGKELTFIEQYQRWYCYNCSQYV